MKKTFILFFFLLLLLCAIAVQGGTDSEKFLFVWAGDQDRKDPDFLAVINFNEHSKKYGSVISTVALPGPGSKSNEPHHVGLSADGKFWLREGC